MFLQMTCGHQSVVTSVDARWPGSVHDLCILQESLLGHQFEEGMTIIHIFILLSCNCNSDNCFSITGLFDGLLLWDRGYPCTKNLMTPYPDPQTPAQNRFNVALSKCRVRIEMTFGVIKSRFSCLHGLRVSPKRACQIISACVVLHNIAAIRKERVPHTPLVAADVVDPIILDEPTGVAVRQTIAQHFFI